MKKYLIVLILFLLTINSYAQRRGSFIGWVTVGLKGAVGNSVFLNKNVMNDNQVAINYLSLSYNYGVKAGVRFNEALGIYYEFMPGYFSTEYSLMSPDKYDKTINFKTSEHLFVIRAISTTGAWFEIGPKFTSAKDLTINNTTDGSYNDINDNLTNLSYTSLSAGFGFSAYISDNATINIGARVGYSFTDFVNDNTHQIVSDGKYIPVYDSYEKSNPFTLQVTAEFTYDIAFFGKASCGAKRIIFFQ